MPMQQQIATIQAGHQRAGRASGRIPRGSLTVKPTKSFGILRNSTNSVEISGSTPVDDWRFQAWIFTSIILNAIQMGLQVDLKGEPYDSIWDVLANLFTAIFALEMCVKVYFLGLEYFNDRWNLLDFVIAWLGILDTWILPLFVDAESVLLPLQSLRLVRIVKLLRMRSELMALITGLVGSLQSMMWIGILLLMVIYTFGIFCAQIIGSADYSETPLGSLHYFDNLPRAMLTLLNVCIVDSWGTLIWSLVEVQPFLVPMFVAFLVLTSFGLLNALIGVIVEQTTRATQLMDEDSRRRIKRQKMGDVQRLADAVCSIDQDSDGCITEEEMASAENVPGLRGILKDIELPEGLNLRDLHTMLDRDGDGVVDKTEFVQGMYRLIYCSSDTFQAHCLTQLTLARIRKAVVAAKVELKSAVEEAMGDMKKDIDDLRKRFATASAHAPEPPRVKVRTAKKPRGDAKPTKSGNSPQTLIEDEPALPQEDFARLGEPLLGSLPVEPKKVPARPAADGAGKPHGVAFNVPTPVQGEVPPLSSTLAQVTPAPSTSTPHQRQKVLSPSSVSPSPQDQDSVSTDTTTQGIQDGSSPLVVHVAKAVDAATQQVASKKKWISVAAQFSRSEGSERSATTGRVGALEAALGKSGGTSAPGT